MRDCELTGVTGNKHADHVFAVPSESSGFVCCLPTPLSGGGCEYLRKRQRRITN